MFEAMYNDELLAYGDMLSEMWWKPGEARELDGLERDDRMGVLEKIIPMNDKFWKSTMKIKLIYSLLDA